MDALKIIWKKRALSRVETIAQWYEENMGYTAERHFLQGIQEVVDTLSQMPTMGKPYSGKTSRRIKYYSFVAHPKYIIIYYFTSKSIYIVTIFRVLKKKG